jgi:hypothetical protein
VRSGEYGRCGKTVPCCPVVLPAPLGQAQSDVQGCRRVATAISSCAKAEDAYDKFNCVDGEGSSCSGACLQSLLLD